MKQLPILVVLASFSSVAAHAQPIEFNVAFKSTIVSPEDAVGSVALDLYNKLVGTPGLSANANELKTILGYVAATSNTDEINKAYEAISAKSASAETTLVNNNAMGFQFKDVGKRLSALRRGAKQAGATHFRKTKIQLFSLDDSSNANIAGNAGGSRYSGFFSGDFSNAEQTETVTEVGFNAGTNRFSTGVDYRIDDSAFTGVALSYLGGNVDLTSAKGTLDTQEFGATWYATYFLTQSWYMDGVIGVSKRNFDLSRKINFTANSVLVTKTADSSPDGKQLSTAVNLGREFSWNNGFSMATQAGAMASTSDISAFDENNAGGLNLHVDAQEMKSVSLNVGANMSKPVGLGFGVLVPQASIYAYHEFSLSGEAIRARFVNDPFGTQFSFTTSDKDQNYLSLSLGASLVLPGGTTSFVQWSSQQFIEYYQQWALALGVRTEF